MNKNNYGVIFDFDGLIVDTEPFYLQAMRKMAKKRGKSFSIDLKREVMGAGGLISMSIMKKALELPDSPQELLEDREKYYGEILFSKGVKPTTGLFNALKVINKLGFKKAIASSSRIKFIDFALEQLNIANEFDTISHGEEVANGKPAPDIFLLTLKKLELPATKCVVLEDTITGVRAGKSAGIKCIAIPNQYNQDTDFSLADAVIESLDELSEPLLKKLLCC